jgi:hypothetical protein
VRWSWVLGLNKKFSPLRVSLRATLVGLRKSSASGVLSSASPLGVRKSWAFPSVLLTFGEGSASIGAAEPQEILRSSRKSIAFPHTERRSREPISRSSTSDSLGQKRIHIFVLQKLDPQPRRLRPSTGHLINGQNDRRRPVRRDFPHTWHPLDSVVAGRV